MKNKKIVCIFVCMLLIATALPAVGTMISGKHLKNSRIEVNKTVNDGNELIKVVIGPYSSNRNLDEYEVITEISKEEALDLKEQLLYVEDLDTLSSEEIISNKLRILREYQILPSCFTFENITKILRNNGECKKTVGLPLPIFGKTYTNVGPHLIFYVSLGIGATPFHVGRDIPLAGNITRLVDILDLDPEIEELLEDFWIFSYAHYTDVLILIGGSTGSYASVGVFPSVNDATFTFSGPFFGVYVLYVGIGIYFYDKKDIERAWFDIFIGICPILSIQQYILAD